MQGRKKLNVADLFAYEEERKRRIELKKRLIEEIESKELTFQPQKGEISKQIQEELLAQGKISVHPVTKTLVCSPEFENKRKPSISSSQILSVSKDTSRDESLNDYEEAPDIIIESDHPYRHNMNSYTVVRVPGAVSYSIRFDPDTKTEAVYDFIRFYDDDTHTVYFGAGKYSGGTNGSVCNWPGVGNRAPLTIPAGRFIVHFRSNNTLNDWGYRMYITPTVMKGQGSGGIRVNDKTNQEPIHQRLYRYAIEKQTESQYNLLDMMQSKLNISLKPWELPKAMQPSDSPSKVNSKSHLRKAPTVQDYINDMVLMQEDSESIELNQSEQQKTVNSTITFVEFDESLANLWMKLNSV